MPAPRDPTRDLRGALVTRRPKHLAAILEPKRVGELLRAIEGYEGQPVTKYALLMSPHVFVRPGELRKAEWKEVDLDTATWRIEASKMKGRQEHVVPLSQQVVELLREARNLTGRGQYVFPSLRTPKRPMSENTVNGALRRLVEFGIGVEDAFDLDEMAPVVTEIVSVDERGDAAFDVLGEADVGGIARRRVPSCLASLSSPTLPRMTF